MDMKKVFFIIFAITLFGCAATNIGVDQVAVVTPKKIKKAKVSPLTKMQVPIDSTSLTALPSRQ